MSSGVRSWRRAGATTAARRPFSPPAPPSNCPFRQLGRKNATAMPDIAAGNSRLVPISATHTLIQRGTLLHTDGHADAPFERQQPGPPPAGWPAAPSARYLHFSFYPMEAPVGWGTSRLPRRQNSGGGHGSESN